MKSMQYADISRWYDRGLSDGACDRKEVPSDAKNLDAYMAGHEEGTLIFIAKREGFFRAMDHIFLLYNNGTIDASRAMDLINISRYHGKTVGR